MAATPTPLVGADCHRTRRRLDDSTLPTSPRPPAPGSAVGVVCRDGITVQESDQPSAAASRGETTTVTRISMLHRMISRRRHWQHAQQLGGEYLRNYGEWRSCRIVDNPRPKTLEPSYLPCRASSAQRRHRADTAGQARVTSSAAHRDRFGRCAQPTANDVTGRRYDLVELCYYHRAPRQRPHHASRSSRRRVCRSEDRRSVGAVPSRVPPREPEQKPKR